jgi:hypothetical protein
MSLIKLDNYIFILKYNFNVGVNFQKKGFHPTYKKEVVLRISMA